MKFKCVSSHPECIVDGREIAPFEEVELEPEQYEDAHFQDALARGAFIGLSAKARKEEKEAKA